MDINYLRRNGDLRRELLGYVVAYLGQAQGGFARGLFVSLEVEDYNGQDVSLQDL
jgi:hypothetical protein